MKKHTDTLTIRFDISTLYPSEVLDLIERIRAIENVSEWTADGQRCLGATLEKTTYDDNGRPTGTTSEDAATSQWLLTSNRAKAKRGESIEAQD